MELLNKDFEHFFSSLKKDDLSKAEIATVCQPLFDYQRKVTWKKWSKFVLGFVIIYFLNLWSENVNWFFTALGRILLIQILPMWNWSKLYNAKCLIDRPIVNDNYIKPITNNYPGDIDNCLLCESIDYIPTVSNTSFSILENKYLEKGLPVLITDSHAVELPEDIFQTIFNKCFSFLESSHCDASTNLVIKKFFDTEIVLRKAWKLMDSTEKWFIQLRACQASSVKSSRLFIKRPYYYPHLESFYSSWLIMSHNFNHRDYREINVQGLIIVQQLSGSNNLKLLPKEPCYGQCPTINIQLNEGEGFVFSTDLWILQYRFLKMQTSITTIMEIDWTV